MNLSIKPNDFFELLLKEIEVHEALRGYYRFLQNPTLFDFRRAYYLQRLEYVAERVGAQPGARIWDLGCGYGTTAIFLALNGYEVRGSTLEYYFSEIPQRMTYWSQFGDLSHLKLDYENLFDHQSQANEAWDFVIVQDTLHHLEPIDEALKIIAHSLRKGGEMIAVEENGMNVVQRLKLFKQRGNNRIITIHDERLGKDILLGNENIRPLSKWRELCAAQELVVADDSVHYVRLFPPFKFRGRKMEDVIQQEQRVWRKNSFLRNYFFFGVDFSAKKS